MSTEHQPKPGEHESKAPFSAALRDTAPYVGLGFQLAAAVVVFYFIGSWIDDRTGASPLWKLVGVFVGGAGGLINFVRTVSRLADRNDRMKPG